MPFAPNFLWGSASAAYQVEGGWNADGKGISVWDRFAKIPRTTYQGTNGDVAVDHYHRWREDIALMAEMGLQTYRFSIAWTRILPQGRGEVNRAGVQFYSDLIDELLKHNIEPMITLYHWDLPQALQDLYGGWESREIISDFLNYARVCFAEFGDRVKYWIVLNEPNIFIKHGYQSGLHPPGKRDMSAFWQVSHHAALVHAHTVLLCKEMLPEAQIGSSIAYGPAYAFSEEAADQQALTNFYDHYVWWWFDPYYKGTYPAAALAYNLDKYHAPLITAEDEEILHRGAASSDFIGVNYYRSEMVAANPEGIGFQGLNTTGDKASLPENGLPYLFKVVKNHKLQATDWDWTIDPDAFRWGLIDLYQRYQLPIVISENGLGAVDVVRDTGEVEDQPRIDYLRDHILALEQAVDAGVPVLAYCTWSFTDLLSWLNGYKKQYGFVYINHQRNLERRKKASWFWYKDVIASHGQILHS